MTELRDLIAIEAMKVIIIDNRRPDQKFTGRAVQYPFSDGYYQITPANVALQAYDFADAMLTARDDKASA